MEKLVLKCGREEHYLLYANILFVEADGPYTSFYTREGKYIVCKNIGYYETILPAPPFARVHHSFIINIEKIVVNCGDSVILDGHVKRIPVSRRKKDGLKKLLAKMECTNIPVIK